MSRLVSSLTGSSVVQCSTCLVKSNPVELVAIPTVIIPLWFSGLQLDIFPPVESSVVNVLLRRLQDAKFCHLDTQFSFVVKSVSNDFESKTF